MEKYIGEEFLNKLYKDLATNPTVINSGDGSNKNEDLKAYLDRIEKINKRYQNFIENERSVEFIKKMHFNKFVIKEDDIPDSYFELQKQIALDRGYGHVEYTPEIKAREIKNIINEQEESLSSWIDYLASKDTEHYPTWFKYYVYRSILKMGYYDKKSGEFTKRTKTTVKPFIEIDREALAMVYDYLIKYLKHEELNDEKLETLLNNGSFNKIYAYCIKQMDILNKDNTNSDEGIWKKYNKGTDPNILFNDIHGKGTGWCTAGGIETASAHLKGGDFYVYFTKDKNGEFKNPRIAIRMENQEIAEVRGIASNQNLESNMERIAKEKLKEFPDGQKYEKKVKDMEMLTYIYIKYKNKVELTKDDLIFLYEVNNKIEYFGYEKDPRIKEILATRTDKKADLAFIFDCNKENISLTREEWENSKKTIIYHYGGLFLYNLTSAEGLKLPENIGGDLVLNSLTSTEGLKLPENIVGSLHLNSLTSAEGLVFPENIVGGLFLNSLTSAEGLKLPENIGGDLYLNSLTSAKGLKLPENIVGSLNLDSLTSAEGVVFPENIGGGLFLYNLTSAEGLKLPENISGDLYLMSLTSAKGLKFPENIVGSLHLDGLTSAKGLVLPENMRIELSLNSLTNAEGLKLPKNMGRTLSLNGLTSAEGLILPENIGGNLFLKSLRSAEGLKLPENIGGALSLNGLTSAEGLVLPENINGRIYLNGLKTIEGLNIPEHLLDKVVLPPSIKEELMRKRKLNF